ncbi:MAG: DUF4115 domain-containing protein [Bryobacterales bacterium]|nr:DUF4115 domain-containing protein [Bryobacterales bacterium]
MNSVGERLRLERLRQGREVTDIAAQTRINPRYIEAIEAGDLSRLPGGFFYRSFVRQYAGVLGLDEAEIDQELDALMGPPEEVYGAALRGMEPIDVPPMPAAGRSESARQIPVSLVFLVLVIIAASLLFSLWQRSRRESQAVPETVATQPAPAPAETPAAHPGLTPAQTTAPAAVTPAQSVSNVSTAPPSVGVATPAVPAAATPPPLPASTPAGAIGTVRVVATGDVWVRLASGGKNLLERTLKAGESRTVALTEPGTMRVGDAANLQVWWDGQQLAPLGPAGQLRDVHFSSSGARVSLPPRPPPPPAPVPPESSQPSPAGPPGTPAQTPAPPAASQPGATSPPP